GMLKLWDAQTGRELRALTGHSSWIGSVAFSADGLTLGSAGGDATVRLWETVSGRELHTLHGHSAPVTSIAFAPKESLLASSDESGAIELWDLATGRELRSLRGHTDVVESVAFSPEGRLLASASSDSTIRLWDIASGAERLRLIAFRDGSFLEITPQGYYDFQDPARHDNAEEYLNVRVDHEVSGISAYRERFYRPDIVQLALRETRLPETLPTLASVKPAPDIAPLDVPAVVEGDALDLKVSVTDRGGGIGDIRTLVNGSAVSVTAGRAIEVVAAGAKAGAESRTIHVRLVPGENDIEVIAFNTEGSVHSNPAKGKVTAHYHPSGKPQLYALVVGIQDFESSRLHLNYSVADATAVAQTLRDKAAPLFGKVNVEPLITPKATTKSALESAFARYTTIDPNDVFLFYVASHGAVEGTELASREYFLIPSNVSDVTDEAIRRDALSEEELKRLISSIPATHKVLLLDTCHAGAMGNAMMIATRAREEDAAADVLASAGGAAVLSASSSDQEALEGEEGHGLFTWVLLKGLGGAADPYSTGYVSTVGLADYVLVQVPKISEQRYNHRQDPNLHNPGYIFPIVSSR
ncbi:MAG: caspase family protein, partial [Gammaproteobacteria bacterium]|nr:caspase family protein [Gammaproteobacteria bacterium]